MKTLCAIRVAFHRISIMALALPCGLCLGLAGCHATVSGDQAGAAGETEGAGEHGSVEDVSIQLEVDKTRVLQKEADLQSSSKNLATEQAKLERERAEAEEKLKSISQADKASRAKAEAVQASIAEQERLLRSRQAELENARAQLDKDKTALLTRAVKPAAPAAPAEVNTSSVRAREEAVAKREAFLAAREKEVATREASAAQSMAELKALMEALRADVSELKNTPQPPPAPSAAPTGPAVTKGQVLRAVRAIRQKMTVKGMLLEDLPQGMQGFAQLANQISGPREAQAAQTLCDRVAQSVDATPINHAFVEGKMARINRTLSAHSAKLDGANQKKVQDLLSEATDAFSDGRYDRANKKINQICALLPGSEAR